MSQVQYQMRRTQIFLLFIIVSCLSLLLSSMPDDGVPRLINDPYDLSNYQDRGSWVVLGQQPYRDVFSEYPQLATYMFALPHIFAKPFGDAGDTYRVFFSLMMAVCLTVSALVIYELRSDRKYLAFLMFLPASIYFTHNRYDIVPAMFTILSIFMLFKKRFLVASFLLAISVMFKWYPVVLLPIYFAYYHTIFKRINWRMIAIFCVTIGLIILPTILAVGWEGFLVPYQFHLGRGVNRESLPFLIVLVIMAAGLFEGFIKSLVYNLFLLLQVAIPFVSVFGVVRDKLSVLAWSSSAILCFMLFAKYYSPQWLLWIVPFLILLARNRRDVVMIVLFDLLTYLKFPVAFDLADHSKFGYFDVLILLNILFLLYFVYRSLSTIYSESRFAPRLI